MDKKIPDTLSIVFKVVGSLDYSLAGMERIPKFIRLSHRDKGLFLEALAFLCLSKVLLLCLPFKTCIKLLKSPEDLNQTIDPAMLKSIRAAVTRANLLAFWKNICLVKSFAARFMLQRRKIGSCMVLGLMKEGDRELKAHAWLVSNDLYVTPRGPQRYTEIFRV